MSSPSRNEPDFSPGRFELRSLLGWGGMGVVYEAFDRQRRSRVALKTLLRMDAAGLLRFKNEFRSLVDLAHPNLVRLGELLEENGQLFFTMELVSGVPFVDHVRGEEPRQERASQAAPRHDDLSTVVRPAEHPREVATAPPVSGMLHEGRLRASLSQLALGLGALHASGRVHRDIKPSNVLVGADGRLVILDFGLVTETSGQDEDAEHVVGTAHFMAPEQAMGKAVTAAADWYSVGVMLYLAMTGKLPFDVASDAVASYKQAARPLPPSALLPGLPADLEALTLALLSIDPAARATGSDVLRVLGVAGSPISTVSAVTPPAFVGRQRELDELARAFDDALRGEARALFIEGESGVGKTTLARKFIGRLAPSALVLAARCYERESVPYKAVDGIVDRIGPYLSKLPPDQALALLPADIGLAATVFPVLALADSVAKKAIPPASSARPPQPLGDGGLVLDLLDTHEQRASAGLAPGRPRSEPPLPPEPRRAPEMDPAELRARVFTAMRELFANLARDRPLILAIDDLQWADADSLALLSEILRPPSAAERAARPTQAALLLVATVRTGTEVSPTSSVTLALPRELLRTLQLTRMPPGEARDLVGALLRTLSGATPLEGSLDVAALLSEGRGHPLFLDALVRHRVAHAEASGPLRLDDALWARMAALPPRTRMLLTVVSVAGGPVARRVAQHALSAEPEEVDRLIAALRSEHFARTTSSAVEEAFEPYHDRIRETVTSRLAPGELRGWHARLALALETMGSGELEELSVHWQGAGDVTRAASYAARAGDEATAAFAFERAARLYQTALSLLPRGASERPSLYLRLGDAHSNRGRGHEAAEAYVAAAELYPEASSLELRRRAAENLLRSGYIDEGMAHLRAVLVAVGLDLPATPSSTLTALLFRRAELRLRGLRFVERHPDKIPAAELRRVDVCWSAAKGLGMVDTLRGAYFQVRALLFALAAGDPYRVSRSLSLELGFVATAGPSMHARIEELLRAARLAATSSRHPHALALIPAMHGVTRFLEGQFTEALPLLVEGERQLRTRCVGVSWETGSTLTFLLWSLWWTGDYGTFCARAPAIIREAEERGDRYLATNLCSGYTNAIWLCADDPDTARARAASAIGPWSRGGSHLQHFHDVVARVQTDLYRGLGAAAYEHITSGWPRLDESMNLRIQIVRITCEHLRGAAALAASRHDLDRSALLHVATRAAKRLTGERVPWAAPLAALLRAGARARDDERGTRVTTLLEEAERGAEACGMAGHAIAARWAQGKIRGGPEGEALVAAAEAELAARGIKAPARFANLLAPGFED